MNPLLLPPIYILFFILLEVFFKKLFKVELSKSPQQKSKEVKEIEELIKALENKLNSLSA
jgi:phosphotransferase system  glucose/maltose/N-acetylglucosamine-specific IIC component